MGMDDSRHENHQCTGSSTNVQEVEDQGGVAEVEHDGDGENECARYDEKNGESYASSPSRGGQSEHVAGGSSPPPPAVDHVHGDVDGILAYPNAPEHIQRRRYGEAGRNGAVSEASTGTARIGSQGSLYGRDTLRIGRGRERVPVRVFGQALEDVVKMRSGRLQLPRVLVSLCEYVVDNGLRAPALLDSVVVDERVYDQRLNDGGLLPRMVPKSAVDELVRAIELGETITPRGPYVAISVLRKYLQALQKPIIPPFMYKSCLAVVRDQMTWALRVCKLRPSFCAFMNHIGNPNVDGIVDNLKCAGARHLFPSMLGDTVGDSTGAAGSAVDMLVWGADQKRRAASPFETKDVLSVVRHVICAVAFDLRTVTQNILPIFRRLPDVNRSVLQYLGSFLVKLSENQRENGCTMGKICDSFRSFIMHPFSWQEGIHQRSMYGEGSAEYGEKWLAMRFVHCYLLFAASKQNALTASQKLSMGFGHRRRGRWRRSKRAMDG